MASQLILKMSVAHLNGSFQLHCHLQVILRPEEKVHGHALSCANLIHLRDEFEK